MRKARRVTKHGREVVMLDVGLEAFENCRIFRIACLIERGRAVLIRTSWIGSCPEEQVHPLEVFLATRVTQGSIDLCLELVCNLGMVFLILDEDFERLLDAQGKRLRKGSITYRIRITRKEQA